MGIYSHSDFSIVVQTLCILHDCSETSGFRTIKRARGPRVKSTARMSRHLWRNEQGKFCGGKASDLVLDVNTPKRRKALRADAKKLGLVALDEGDHIHVHDAP